MSKLKEAQKNQLPSLIKKASWDGVSVEYGLLDAVGEFDFAMPKQAISIAFAPHDRVTWSVDGGSSQTTALPAGSAFVYGDMLKHDASRNATLFGTSGKDAANISI
ncbi:MAG: hypothetical protein WBA41_04545 [Rivularia sp. (in: cyanobacteria)]